MEGLELDIEEIIKEAKKSGGVISEESLGEKLINYELSVLEMNKIKERLEEEGIAVEESVDDAIKDEELKFWLFSFLETAVVACFAEEFLSIFTICSVFNSEIVSART